jgi:hypothetical protein
MESRKTNSQETPNRTDGTGYYVYCIADSLAAQEIIEGAVPRAIEDNVALELITRNPLTAVVSEVPLSEFGEDALESRLTDATWTAIHAMRHEQVVEHFASRTSVVPLRFGTIYLDRAGIEQMLGENEKKLSEIVERLRGRVEWGVNVYCNRQTLMDNITNLSPRLRQMREEAKEASPGQAYLLQKKIETQRADEAKVEIARAVDDIEKVLSQHSDGSTKLRILKVETTEHGELKAKFAFLVLKAEFESFRNAAEELAEKMEQSGIRIELTGPWPAYNFASD